MYMNMCVYTPHININYSTTHQPFPNIRKFLCSSKLFPWFNKCWYFEKCGKHFSALTFVLAFRLKAFREIWFVPTGGLANVPVNDKMDNRFSWLGWPPINCIWNIMKYVMIKTGTLTITWQKFMTWYLFS